MIMDTKHKKHLKWQLPFLLLLIVGSVLIIRKQYSTPYQQCQGNIFGTTYHITYQYDDDLQKDIEAELQKVDSALSMFNQQSVLSLINRNERLTVDNQMFIDVFKLAQQISAETSGAFDITVAPLVNLWGFGFKSGTMPTQEKVDSLRQLIGYQKVSLETKNTGGNEQLCIKKADPRIMLDCSAIAKGYGVDVVARLLSSKSIDNYMVEIGGEVITKGISERRVPWVIGVNKPVENDSLVASNELQTTLNVTDMAMATSGNYRRFYYKNGRRYAHTIDPKTGNPVQHSLLSATVLAKDCATADAYATAFMVMGLDPAKKLLEKHPELMAYLIYTDPQGSYCVWYSPKLSSSFPSSKE